MYCGIDEAGKGCVVGSLVMAGVTLSKYQKQKLKKLGVKDSKLLSLKKRDELFDVVKNNCLNYKIISVKINELNNLPKINSNLVKLEAEKSAVIINELKPDSVIMDCPSINPVSYLSLVKNQLISTPKIKAEHKADLNYIEVAAASILAKVTRDNELKKIHKKYGDCGSGYMSDPKTQEYLKQNWDKQPIFRKTWESWKRLKRESEQSSLFKY